jgi:hypothetical protein
MDLTSAVTAYHTIRSGVGGGEIGSSIPQNYQEMLNQFFASAHRHRHSHHQHIPPSPISSPTSSCSNSPNSSSSSTPTGGTSTSTPTVTTENLLSLLNYFHSSTRWEDHAFDLLLSIHILQSSHYRHSYSDLIQFHLHPNMKSYLTHEEPRVRQITCQLIGILVQSFGYEEYQFLVEVIIRCVQENSQREHQTRPVILGDEKELALDEVTGWKSLETSYNAFKELVKGLRHYLLINNDGVPPPPAPPPAAAPVADPTAPVADPTAVASDLSELNQWKVNRVAPIGSNALQIFVIDAGVHMNRYVRQCSCELIEIMCQTPSPVTHHQSHHSHPHTTAIPSPIRSRSSSSSLFTEFPSLAMVIAIRNILAIGLQDSWCQVRLAATLATKSFLMTISQNIFLEQHVWPLILPRLCLNRHYSTDSVKEIAQETWIQRLGSRGRELLTEFMSDVVPYYVSMTRHKNHIVCEAACASIAELGTPSPVPPPPASSLSPSRFPSSSIDLIPSPVSRIPSSSADQYLSLMLVALRDSLVDASWPVRDRACIAIGRYLRSIWNRNLDLQSPADIRLIPIPTTQSILNSGGHLPIDTDTPQGHAPEAQEEGEEAVLPQAEQEKLTVLQILQESVEILLNYLHTDPFRPVRESAAIAIVDCLLPPLAPMMTTENPLKVSLSLSPRPLLRPHPRQAPFQNQIWKKIENYLQSYLLAAVATAAPAETSFPFATTTMTSSSSSTTTATTRPVNKAIRFLPDSVVTELMSGATVTVRNTNDTNNNSEFKPLVSSSLDPSAPGGMLTGETLSWGGSVKGKMKRSKPRVGGGWGCCLDCAAGENRPLYPWEESETAILLLRELIGTLPQTNPESEERIRGFLRSQVKVCLCLTSTRQS